MHSLGLDHLAEGGLHILCLGAHADDIEIGCGGSVLKLLDGYPNTEVRWVVFASGPVRAPEAENGATRFLSAAGHAEVTVRSFRDSFFPEQWSQIKEYFEALKETVSPDLIFTHFQHDRHQDHRVISELTWNTWRNHLILEYEIPKFDGDLSQPNCFFTLGEDLVSRKIEHLIAAFPSQADKPWFHEETFRGLMRLRGVECRAVGGYAEAFHGRKLVLG
jgi:LmbE family N-acetylglucosaminyl deacetylase